MLWRLKCCGKSERSRIALFLKPIQPSKPVDACGFRSIICMSTITCNVVNPRVIQSRFNHNRYRAVLREDAGFHAYQMLEAGVRQFTEWEDTAAGQHILIAVVCYLGAYSPTERAALQTADIAQR
jgi:hypothetical protein